MEPLRQGDPRQAGDYRLEGRLGGGGMGQVFLGRTPGGRPVAVKLVRPELADDADFRRRFAVEVEAASLVGGFYTAQVVAADPDADPPWLATAYIPGPSLHQAVATHGPLPAETITVLGAGLAEGLARIHACNLVHRDLKPSNVILAEDGPRVIDFGITRALDATSHTLSRAVVGTPSFMSPEQARGHEIGQPSDVFSLGLVLAFAATGRSPFGDGQAAAIVYRIVHDEPDLTGLPAHLADLVSRCLTKDPGNRPGVAHLLEELANSADATAQWLPPTITTMITECLVETPIAPAPLSPPDPDTDKGGTQGDPGDGPAAPRQIRPEEHSIASSLHPPIRGPQQPDAASANTPAHLHRRLMGVGPATWFGLLCLLAMIVVPLAPGPRFLFPLVGTWVLTAALTPRSGALTRGTGYVNVSLVAVVLVISVTVEPPPVPVMVQQLIYVGLVLTIAAYCYRDIKTRRARSAHMPSFEPRPSPVPDESTETAVVSPMVRAWRLFKGGCCLVSGLGAIAFGCGAFIYGGGDQIAYAIAPVVSALVAVVLGLAVEFYQWKGPGKPPHGIVGRVFPRVFLPLTLIWVVWNTVLLG